MNQDIELNNTLSTSLHTIGYNETLPTGTTSKRLSNFVNQLARFTNETNNVAYFVNLTSIRYLTNFTGSNATLIIHSTNEHPNQIYFVTDARYLEQAKLELSDLFKSDEFDVEILDQSTHSVVQMLQTSCENRNSSALSIEYKHFTVDKFLAIQDALGSACKFHNIDNVLADQRSVKEPFEIELLKCAAQISTNAFEACIDSIQGPISEIDLARELNYTMLKLGATGIAFDTIVASGNNSSYPHAQPTNRRIMLGDLVVIDFGAEYFGYRSDCTRSIAYGGEFSDRRIDTTVEIVKSAQQAGIDSCQIGTTFSDIDRACRASMPPQYAKRFTHGTGHGIGLDIHESPWVSPSCNQPILGDMVFTIEPGVYFPGEFGVRIEDSILTTVEGPIQITNLSKSTTYENFTSHQD